MECRHGGKGAGRRPIDEAEHLSEQLPRHRKLRQLESDIPAVAHDLGANLDQLLLSVVRDQCSTAFGKASVRMKLPRL